ncbi:MAG: aspartate carbamoyltransferase catalytic subunit [Candidatus Atribacteria bacterium]|nr:aspartate carbamoyltransferase catalytic subunit [Candidatus Atribacteria bacterium]
MWKHKHLLGMESLSREDIGYLLEKGNAYRDYLERSPKGENVLQGYFLINMFFESSTRTRVSFEMAGKLLGMEVINFTTDASSVQKGESLRDTVRTLSRMKVDAMVVRHRSSGIPFYLSQFLPFHIINAGDGIREHPTQALLDLLAMQRSGVDFSHLTVAIIGDILHSRVARSLSIGLQKLGSTVIFSGPPTLIPRGVEVLGGEVIYPVEEAMERADIIYLLRIQKERQEAGYFPSGQEYARYFGLNSNAMDRWGKNKKIMHPGPVNRGMEIASCLVEDERSLIEEQVSCGLAVRMAVLETLLQEGKES